MDFHYVTYILDILLLFAFPIGLGVYLVRKFDLDGSLWWIGALVYVVSLIAHSLIDNYLILPYSFSMDLSQKIPSVTLLIIFAILMGLSTGLSEGLLCYGAYRWWAKSARTWLDAVLIGTGIGSAGAIWTGIGGIYEIVIANYYRNPTDANTSTAEILTQDLQAQVNAYWSAPWYSTFTHFVQQIFMILTLISFSVLILQVFTRKQWFWILIAIGFQTSVIAVDIILNNLANRSIAFSSLCFFALASIFCFFAFGNPKFAKYRYAPGQSGNRLYRTKTPKSVEESLEAFKKDKRN
jgi:uncharacterized membrane protein YhfC